MTQALQCSSCKNWLGPTVESCPSCGTPVRAGEDASQAPTIHSAAGAAPAGPSQDGLEHGTVLAGRYRVLEEIGRGGMGVVYRVEDLEIQEILALKMLAPAVAERPGMIQRFKQEMKLSRQIAHARVCKIYDLGEADGRYFITMQYVDGDSLGSLLKRVGPPRVVRLRQWVDQLCEGLAEAHRLGIVHRDLKPANVMIDHEGNAVIMDFGLAVSVETHSETHQGGIEGTPGYMAPEQARGEPGDARVDVYALGCILYELLSGDRPFTADSVPQLIVLQSEGRHKSLPRDLQIDPELEEITTRCLAVEPADRFGSVKEIQTVLERGFVDRDLSATEQDRFKLAPATAWLGGLAVLAAVAAVPLYRGSSWGQEIRVDFPRQSALSKGREIVRQLGYSVDDRKAEVNLRTFGDQRLMLESSGIDGLRSAIREGEVTEWSVAFNDPDRDQGFEPGEFVVRIGLDGKLHYFRTPATEDSDAEPVAEAEARQKAAATLAGIMPVELSTYHEEILPRNFPPGVTEVIWRNPDGVLGHREEVRVDLQGSDVIRVSRTLRAPQEWTNSESRLRELTGQYRTVVGGAFAVALFVMYGAGAVYLFRQNRWSEARQAPAIVCSALFAAALLLLILADRDPWDSALDLLAGTAFATLCFGIGVIIYAGLLSWLADRNVTRQLDLRGLARARFLDLPAASALVHGVLGGLIATGFGGIAAAISSRLPGYLPSAGAAYDTLEAAMPLGKLLGGPIIAGLFTATWIAVGVEIVERLRRPWLLIVLAAVSSLFAVVPGTLTDAATGNVIAQSVVSFSAAAANSLVAIALYRRYGFATVLVAMTVNRWAVIVADLFATDSEGPMTLVAVTGVLLIVALLGLGLAGLVRGARGPGEAASAATV